MGNAVDDEAAHPADTLAAVGVERDGVLPLANEPFVDDVEHLEERHVGRDVGGAVVFETPGRGASRLTPDFEIESHWDPFGAGDWGLGRGVGLAARVGARTKVPYQCPNR